MQRITQAVVLMAGAGSRFRGENDILKPLVSLLGRPLISHTLEALARAAVARVHIVVGYRSDELRQAVAAIAPAELELCFVENTHWKKQNGVSLLAAASSVTAPFLLTMSDHVFDQTVIDVLLAGAALNELNVAIDRKLNSIFDLEDAMKVRMEHDRVMDIGKDLKNYNAVDTGVFVCPAEIFGYLETAREHGDVSLADGVRAMAHDGKVRGIDVGDARWQDIDTPEMLRHAERMLAKELA